MSSMPPSQTTRAPGLERTNDPKALVHERLVTFQRTIADLNHARHDDREAAAEREQALLLGLCSVLDAIEAHLSALEQPDATQAAPFEQPPSANADLRQQCVRAVRIIHRKVSRLLKTHQIVKMTFPDNKATMDRCKVVQTKSAPGIDEATIVAVVTEGYINRETHAVLRRAEVITVRNDPASPPPTTRR